MRWRVGRKPTWRSMAFTSCQGQPVSSARAAGTVWPADGISAPGDNGVVRCAMSALALPSSKGSVGRLFHPQHILIRTADATPSQQAVRGDLSGAGADFAPLRAYVREAPHGLAGTEQDGNQAP